MDLPIQVHSVGSAKEALELLASAPSGGVPLYDIILKEHEPQDGANACRLLRKMARAELLAKIPVVCKFTQRRKRGIKSWLADIRKILRRTLYRYH